MLESIQRLCLNDVYNRDTKGHTQMCLTFISKVKHQGGSGTDYAVAGF